MRNRNLLILACISNTLFRYPPFFFEFGELSENHNTYAVGQALSYILLLVFAIKQLRLTKKEEIICECVFWCAISNLLDELFFNPLVLGMNELVFGIWIIGRCFYKIKQLKKITL